MKHFVVCWALSCWVSLFIPHALEWGSARALGNRENVREGTFVREIMLAKRTFARKLACRATWERTFVQERSQRATGYKMFPRGDLQGHSKERHLVRLDLFYAAMLVNVSIYATDAGKTLLPWNISIAMLASRLLYSRYELYRVEGKQKSHLEWPNNASIVY